jgi:autotransporter-associated beta strand protein
MKPKYSFTRNAPKSLLLAAGWLMAAHAAHADVVYHVDFSNGVSPDFSGTPATILGAAGDTWNFVVPTGANAPKTIPTTVLLDSTGAASGATVTVGTHCAAFYNTPTTGDYNALLQDYIYLYQYSGPGPTAITLGGLSPNSTYDLVGYTQVGTDQGFSWTVNGDTQTATGSADTSSLTAGQNYTRFTQATTDADGKLIITWSRIGTNVFSSLSGLEFTLASAPEVAVYYWDANGNTAGLGGTGAWDTTSSLWTTDVSGSTGSTQYPNATGAMTEADFSGTAGVVTLASGTAITVNGIKFGTTGYTITGADDTATLSSPGVATITTGAGNSATIDAVIAGATALKKANDDGTLTLGGVNTYTGDTSILGGTLTIGGAGQLGSGTYAGAMINSGTFDYHSSAAQTLSGVISGGGSLVQNGSGTLTLNGASNYTGSTTVNSGTLQIGGGNRVSSTSAVINSGATLEYLATAAGIYGQTAITYSGAGVLKKSDSGSFIMGISGLSGGGYAGALTGGPWTGQTVLVQQDAGGFLDVQGGDINIGWNGSYAANNGSLNVATGASFHDSESAFHFDSLTGGGIIGNAFTTPVTLTIGVADNLDNATYGVVANTATFSGSIKNTETYNGVTTGPLSLVKTGSGTQILSGPLVGSYPTSDSSFSGNITVTGGKLIGAALRTGSNTAFGLASNTRSITVDAGATLEFQAPNLLGGHWTTSAPTLVVNEGTVTNADPWATNVINNGLTNVTLNSGTLTSTAGNGFDEIDSTNRPGEVYGAWGLNGTVTSTGTSLISTTAGIAGRVLLGSGVDTTFAVTSGTLTVAATLQAGDAGYLGGLIKTGAGKLVLSAVNVYSSPTTVSEGTLELTGSLVAASGATAPSNITVASGATLSGSGTATGTLAVAGFVAPGTTGVGALGVGATTLSGTYACDIDDATADSLAITGDLDLTGATLALTEVTPATAPSYVIATYTGSLTGTFATVPAGYVVDTATPGQIKLVKSAGGFSDWADSWTGPVLADKTPGGDPDGDGVSNVMEYVIGGDPRVASTSYLPAEAIVGTDLVLSYGRSDASEADTTQTGQWSTNLTDWNDIAPVLVNENDADPDSMEIRIPLTHAVGGKLFGRLNVTQP